MNKPKVISFFSGSGGLDLGFEAANFEVVFASDIMPEACATLRANRPKLMVAGPPLESGDINEMSASKILNSLGLKRGEVDVMVGGPPCQPFSTAAAQRFLKGDKKFKRVGFDSEDKGQLIFKFVELILAIKPKVFLIENVPGILTIDGGTGISVVYQTLEEAGYTISRPMLIEAADYGLPQRRKRAFVVGSLYKKVMNPPTKSHGPLESLFERQHIASATALINIDNGLPNHITRNHEKASINRYRKLVFGQREMLGRVDRLDPLKPSKTVIAGGTSGGGRSHLHPYLARTLTVRECARLQSYPDDYIFHGSIARQFTLVGNSVPPLIGEIMAREIGRAFFGIRYRSALKFSFEGDGVSHSNLLKKQTKSSNKELHYLSDS